MEGMRMVNNMCMYVYTNLRQTRIRETDQGHFDLFCDPLKSRLPGAGIHSTPTRHKLGSAQVRLDLGGTRSSPLGIRLQLARVQLDFCDVESIQLEIRLLGRMP